MSDIAEIMTEEQAITPIIRKFATVGAVYADGVSLIFDGESTATEKHYKTNTSIIFAAGDRVKIVEDSGTYVVEYIVGTPGSDYPLPTGGTTGQVLAKSGDGNYAIAWRPTNGIPSGGITGQVLAKSSDGDYAVQWKTIGAIPTGGTAGQALVKNSATDNDVGWGDIVADKIGTASYYAYMSYVDFLPLSGSSTYPYSLGNSTKPWYSLYTGGGNTRLCISTGKLGFFGATPVSKQTLSSAATATQIVTALKAYGLYT